MNLRKVTPRGFKMKSTRPFPLYLRTLPFKGSLLLEFLDAPRDEKGHNMNSKITKSLFILALMGIALVPQTAHAAALFDSGTNFLTALQDLLTNTWARIIAIIAVVFLGFAWMFGRISWQLAASVIGGVILIFGAPAIVDSISGSI